MDINSINNITNRITDFEQRDNAILKYNDNIKNRLQSQNQHVDRLFKGYLALGTVLPDNGELIMENPTTRDRFIQQLKENENLLADKLNKIENSSDKFEKLKIIEDYIVKMFDLIATRWESILAFLKLWRERRLTSRDESIALMSEYTNLDKTKSTTPVSWNQKAEVLFSRHIEMLDYQEKHLINEEALIKELESLFELRNKLIKMADETFSA